MRATLEDAAHAIGVSLGSLGSWPSHARFLVRGTIDAIINQDPGHEARPAARVLLAHCSGERDQLRAGAHPHRHFSARQFALMIEQLEQERPLA
jgi:hypothetical protein